MRGVRVAFVQVLVEGANYGRLNAPTQPRWGRVAYNKFT